MASLGSSLPTQINLIHFDDLNILISLLPFRWPIYGGGSDVLVLYWSTTGWGMNYQELEVGFVELL